MQKQQNQSESVTAMMAELITRGLPEEAAFRGSEYALGANRDDARFWHKLSLANRLSGRLREAEVYNWRASQCENSTPSLKLEALTEAVLAEIHRKNFQQAEKLLAEAAATAVDSNQRAFVDLMKGRVQLGAGHLVQALSYLERSVDAFAGLGARADIHWRSLARFSLLQAVAASTPWSESRLRRNQRRGLYRQVARDMPRHSAYRRRAKMLCRFGRLGYLVDRKVNGV